MKLFNKNKDFVINADDIIPDILEYQKDYNGWDVIITDITNNETIKKNVYEIHFDGDIDFRAFIDKYGLELIR